MCAYGRGGVGPCVCLWEGRGLSLCVLMGGAGFVPVCAYMAGVKSSSPYLEYGGRCNWYVIPVGGGGYPGGTCVSLAHPPEVKPGCSAPSELSLTEYRHDGGEGSPTCQGHASPQVALTKVTTCCLGLGGLIPRCPQVHVKYPEETCLFLC